ncbi:Splicing factor U2AF 50 kDa subunit [Babesia sp. Xinjiang]|uniref:Splicing factor U2AF 50 kDa subunit n=1 Tax=Babesia sp. Xinjiang TaxID=462227 RepID=UPI000A2382A5|nr:Splicing factor U2AF 50 kDa subunit [Babesia sp. Xinjiang]ORM41370.1 Splicing factor U2AF 50 kDa subunit [Babesia sp. Xinjiang]
MDKIEITNFRELSTDMLRSAAGPIDLTEVLRNCISQEFSSDADEEQTVKAVEETKEVERVPERAPKDVIPTVVLAADGASGLRPLTHGVPKCMILTGKKTLIGRTLDILLDAGIRRILVFVNVGDEHLVEAHLLECIEKRNDKDAVLSGLELTVHALVEKDDASRNTTNVVKYAADLLQSDFLVVPSDLVGTFNLRGLIKNHFSSPRLCTIALLPEKSDPKSSKKTKDATDDSIVPGGDVSRGWGYRYRMLVTMDPNTSQVIALSPVVSVKSGDRYVVNKSALVQHPRCVIRSDMYDAHVYVFSNSILKFLDLPCMDRWSVRTELIPYMVRAQEQTPETETDGTAANKAKQSATDAMRVFQFSGLGDSLHCFRANNMEALLRANMDLCLSETKNAKKPLSEVCRNLMENSGGMLDSEKVSRMERKKKLEEEKRVKVINKFEVINDPDGLRGSIIGEGCRIGEGTTGRMCVLGNCVVIGRNCVLNNCVIMNGAHIKDNVVMTRCVIGETATVKADCKRREAMQSRNYNADPPQRYASDARKDSDPYNDYNKDPYKNEPIRDYKNTSNPRSRSRSRNRRYTARRGGYRDRRRRSRNKDGAARYNDRRNDMGSDVNSEPQEEEFLALNPNLSPSHARSRAAERRRRKAQAECIRRAGGFQRLADQEGHETVRLFWDGFQWVAKTGQAALMMNADSALMNATRKLRRLYFGNLPLSSGLTENAFQNIIWNEMRNRNFCNDPSVSPVLYVWFAKDKGNYGFVEFATVEETERALTMDGMNCMGSQLRVSRPNDYSTSSTKPPAPGVVPQNIIPLDAFTSKYLRVVQIVLPESVQKEIEYLDVLDDVKEAFERHGKIKTCAIVTPRHRDIAPNLTPGDVIVEFVDRESLLACVQNMQHRKYEKREIQFMPMEEDDYKHVAEPLLLDLEALEKEAE